MSSLPIPRQFTAKTISAEKGWNGPPALPCYNLRTPRLGRRAERREAPEGAGQSEEINQLPHQLSGSLRGFIGEAS